MKLGRILLWSFLLILVGGTIVGSGMMLRSKNGEVNWKTVNEQVTENQTTTETEEETTTEQKVVAPETEKQTETELKAQGEVPCPEIDQQILTKNKYSRPGTKVEEIKYLVIHYLGNPKTTAQENRDYFESLKELKNVSMSSNYIIGLDGEIIQCVPDGEIAYASNQVNKNSISIENCNIDETGKLLKDTYISLVKLTAYLAEKYDLDRDHIIRHYDVNGKECPIYYVEHEDYWELFLDDVFSYVELCHEQSPKLKKIGSVLAGVKYTYSSKTDKAILNSSSDKTAGEPHDLEGKDAETETEAKKDTSSETKTDNNSSGENSSSDNNNNYYDNYYDDYYDDYNDNYYDDYYDDYYYETNYNGNYEDNNQGTEQPSAQEPEVPNDQTEQYLPDSGNYEVPDEPSEYIEPSETIVVPEFEDGEIAVQSFDEEISGVSETAEY